MDFDPRIPTLLHPTIYEFVSQLDRQVLSLVSGFYLVGSIALDGFNPRSSDVDFVAVLNRPATEVELERLRLVHQSVEGRYPKWKLEGPYYPVGDLSSLDESQPFLNYHDGKLQWHRHAGLRQVTWWILLNQGITVFGQPPQALPIKLDMPRLLAGQLENLNGYWATWIRRPGRLAALLTDWGVQWTVLGVLRQFYTLREQRIISKDAAGQYALEHLPERWHPVIREALAVRQEDRPRRSLYRSKLTRALDVRAFLKYVVRICNKDGLPDL